MINKRDELLKRRLQLTPEKQALLQKRLRGEAPENSKDTIPRRPEQESVPLSFAQEQLWLLEQLAPKTGAYNIAEAVKLGGKLNIQVLEQAINEIIRRHEILRTTFTYTWQPIQVIAAELSISLSVIDISTLGREKQEKAFKSLSTKEAQYPFDFALGPLLRATLLKLGAEEHLFLLTVPHIIADGWSQHVFIRELTVLYDAFSLGKRSPLPELPLQYADFAYWQRQYLQGEKLERELNYWKRQLAAAPITEIFPDRPRAAIQSFSGAEISFDLPAPLHEPLTLLCQRENITLFMFFLAAFNILLAYYTRMEDIVVGTPITNLHHAELESLIGDFINTLVLRTDLSGNPSFREVLSRVRKISVEAYANKQVPFGLLVEELYIKRDVSRNPLFQIMFVSHDAPKIPLEMPSLTVRAMEIEKKRSIFDLTLQMEGQRGWFGYNTDLFDATTIRRMADHFLTLLEAAIANPEKRISDLSIFTQDEGQQILSDWNDLERKHVQSLFLHQMFEVQAARTPDAIAVISEKTSFTYHELNRRANQVAHRLQKLGVGPEVPIGICMERSLEMVVAIIATLKAGGAYVPMEPTYPKKRLSFMLEDTRAPILLTQQRLREKLSEHNALMIDLDVHWDANDEPEVNPTSTVEGKSPAYIIYTSGSAGSPERMLNTHEDIRNRLLWMQDVLQLPESDQIMQKTPFSFDVSTWECLWPLITGACLVVARPEGHKDNAYLVPLVAEQELKKCSSLEQGLGGGEVLPSNLQERFFVNFDELYDLYGPTETTTDVTS